MPSALRAHVALVGFLAVLLIPIGTSSLRGLTHVLTCQEENDTPFAIEVPEEGPPVISSSQVIERPAEDEPGGDDGRQEAVGELCGGLRLDIAMGSRVEDRTDVNITITNNSEYGWRGSVRLQFDATPIPIDIGQIDSGESASDDVELHLRSGERYEIEGSLLIGP